MTFTTCFRPTPARLSHKLPPSSRAWLARQYRDPYVKARLSYPANYRSRSAFKLVELDHKWKFLNHPDVRTVVDLGAAPGGWSQVVAGKMGWSDSDLDIRLTKDAVAGARGKGKGRSALDAVAAGYGLKREKREEMKGEEGGKRERGGKREVKRGEEGKGREERKSDMEDGRGEEGRRKRNRK